MFSGAEKLFGITKTSKLLQSKINLPLTLCILVIVGVIMLELIGPGVIVYSASTNSKKNIAKLAIIGLIIFTVLATILFHMSEPSQILKNLCVVGGLTLLYDRF
jgi:hypothetical protein